MMIRAIFFLGLIIVLIARQTYRQDPRQQIISIGFSQYSHNNVQSPLFFIVQNLVPIGYLKNDSCCFCFSANTDKACAAEAD